MAVTDTPTKYFVYRNMKQKHNIVLDDNQLNTIDDIYLTDKRSAIFKIAVYRMINAVFALFFILVFFLLRNQKFSKWLFVVMMASFTVYNLIHIWNNYKSYKKIKLHEPERHGME